jgi:glycosyltransferase involved in cell wall biosynthesis
MGYVEQSCLTSLVVPAYNPGRVLDRTLSQLERFLATSPEPWEVVLVSDGCTDGSGERLQHWTAAMNRRLKGQPVRFLAWPRNRGKGQAVKAGLLAARGRFRIFADVDLAYDFVEIRRVAGMLWAGHPVVIADRFLPESRMTLPTAQLWPACWRHVQSTFFRLLASLLLPLPGGDTQAGLKGLRADVVADVVDSLQCPGFAFDCELLTACVQRGWPVKRIPVTVRLDRITSTTVRAWHIWDMVRALLAIRRRWQKNQSTQVRTLAETQAVQHLAA